MVTDTELSGAWIAQSARGRQFDHAQPDIRYAQRPRHHIGAKASDIIRGLQPLPPQCDKVSPSWRCPTCGDAKQEGQNAGELDDAAAENRQGNLSEQVAKSPFAPLADGWALVNRASG